MNYWWVNQKQTYRHEVLGGYMWSPKLDRRGNHNRSYDLMRKVKPGDIVYSFANGLIKAIGLVNSYCYEFPKPTAFGSAGHYWNDAGWRVDVSFKEILNPVRPKDHIVTLRLLLPEKYSPLQNNGDGNQAYLFDISVELALRLAQLMDRWVLDLARGNMVLDMPSIGSAAENIEKWEDSIEEAIIEDQDIPVTVRETLIKSRIGQGLFRQKLLLIEPRCRVTGVDNPVHLIASHTKPWRDCNNEERLDPENGFMLTPTIDHLFDKGFISFEDNGTILLADVADRNSMEKLGVIGRDARTNIGQLRQEQKRYLNWHRSSIFLG